jgi:hypothetical protein
MYCLVGHLSGTKGTSELDLSPGLESSRASMWRSGAGIGGLRS